MSHATYCVAPTGPIRDVAGEPCICICQCAAAWQNVDVYLRMALSHRWQDSSRPQGWPLICLQKHAWASPRRINFNFSSAWRFRQARSHSRRCARLDMGISLDAGSVFGLCALQAENPLPLDVVPLLLGMPLLELELLHEAHSSDRQLPM